MRTAASVTAPEIPFRRPIDLIVVHTTDSPDDRTSVDAKEIDRWHRERGFKMIGYHRVVLKDGRVQMGRPIEKVGAHAKGFNLHSVGVVWVGRHVCEGVQWESLVRTVATYCIAYELDPMTQVKGHRSELTHDGTCPNIDMDRFREAVRLIVKKARGLSREL